MADNFWANKRVLVTGADGFVGSHLVEALLKLDAKVIAFTRGTSTSGTTQLAFKNIAHVADQLEDTIAGNLAQAETTRLIVEAKPDVIMHLGAEAYVPRSFTQPAEVFAVNANGTLHVLEAARQLPNLERVVATSSSEVYGTAVDDKPIAETHPLNPTSPYAASKAAADRLAYSYRVTFDTPVAVIRPFNTYGPRHVYDVIPKFIKLALKGEALTVHGDGNQSRDFTYVEDTVQGFLTMGSHPNAIGQVVNFGSGTTYGIGLIAKRIVELTGSSSDIVHTEARLAEVRNLLCDPSLAKSLFGWEARVGLDEGLRKNIEWERAQTA